MFSLHLYKDIFIQDLAEARMKAQAVAAVLGIEPDDIVIENAGTFRRVPTVQPPAPKITIGSQSARTRLSKIIIALTTAYPTLVAEPVTEANEGDSDPLPALEEGVVVVDDSLIAQINYRTLLANVRAQLPNITIDEYNTIISPILVSEATRGLK